MPPPPARPGDLVDVWDGGGIVSGVLLGEEKGRLRIVTERGDELRVPDSRIAARAGRGAPVEPARAVRAAAEHARRARELAAEIDVASLWEILVDAGGRHGLEDLAGLAFGAADPAAVSALLRRLHEEKTWFERKTDHWEARSRDAVAQAIHRRQVAEEKERRRGAFLEAIRARLRAPAGSGSGGGLEGPFLEALVDLAVRGDESESRREAVSLLDDLGAPGSTPALAAFDLLVRAGIFEADENLEIRRLGLRSAFPPGVEALAAIAAATEPDEPCADLTGLEVFTLDDDETVEIDDGLSWEPGEAGAGRLGIHIADPSARVLPGDPIDEEALLRAATYYFPDRRLPMLPPAISEEAASLVPGRPRRALSFLVRIRADGTPEGVEIVVSRILSRGRLGYEEADRLAQGAGGEHPFAEPLRRLADIARILEAGRAAAGAILVRAPEVDIRVGPGGVVRLKRIDDRGTSRRLVAEFMILANRLAAAWCVDRGIPAIFRRQPPPERPLPPVPDGPYDPVAVRALRRSLRRGEVGVSPGPHAALGLPAYLQATSPIRRFQDLAVQRQIKASLAGRPLPYDAEAMARLAATTDAAERAARAAEAGTDAYWILRHLASRRGEILDAVVLAVEPRRTEVEICETLSIAAIEARPGHAPGRRLRLRVEEARPRELKLRLREVEGEG